MRTLATVFLVVVCLLAAPHAAASAATCSDDYPDYTPAQSFESSVNDVRTLAFIATLENESVSDPADFLESGVAESIDRNCAEADVHLREARARAALNERWGAESDSLDFFLDSAIIGLAVVERSGLPGYVGKPYRERAADTPLAVFGLTMERLDRVLATGPRPGERTAANVDPCNSRAQLVEAIAPNRANLADPRGAVGLVNVDVALDDRGFVRSAKVDDPAILADPHIDADMRSAAVLAAGVSRYAPAFVKCKPSAANVQFHAIFATGKMSAR